MDLNRGRTEPETYASAERLYLEIEADTGENRPKQSSKGKQKLLGLDLSGCSETSQFTFCCCGVFAFYLIYGYFLELIFTLDGLKPYGWYVTLMQFGYYSLFSWTEILLSGGNNRKIPMKTYLLLAALTLGTVGFSNTSLQYLNYPTQVIFKCCKLIPVMLGGMLIQRKKYGILDFSAAFLMCSGLTWFTLADSYLSPTFDTVGVVMISLALLCDAAIGNVQEKAMNAYNVSNTEVVFYSYSLGFTYLLVVMIFTGKFFSGFYFCLHNPIETYGYGLIFASSGYFGIQIVLALVKCWGALAAATVTTCRKAVSIVVSFLFFSKPFSAAYFWSGLLVVLGIYMSVYAKNARNCPGGELAWSNRICLAKCHLGLLRKFKKKKSTHEMTV